MTEQERWKAHARALQFPPREGQPEARAHLEMSKGGWAFCARAAARLVAWVPSRAGTSLGIGMCGQAREAAGLRCPLPRFHFGMLQPETTLLCHPFASFRCQAATLQNSSFPASTPVTEGQPQGSSGMILSVDCLCSPAELKS